MPQDTKNQLSPFQLETLTNTRFFDTKREVTEIIYSLFHDLQLELVKEWTASPLSSKYDSPAPKIFKGENYRGYPYVNLDYPRLFHADSVLAFRTMMWWGNQFSFTLHIQGKALERLGSTFLKNAAALKGKGFFFGVNESPWQYHFGDDNFMRLDEKMEMGGEMENTLPGRFIKISRRLELSQYPDTVHFGKDTFRKILDCLENPTNR